MLLWRSTLSNEDTVDWDEYELNEVSNESHHDETNAACSQDLDVFYSNNQISNLKPSQSLANKSRFRFNKIRHFVKANLKGKYLKMHVPSLLGLAHLSKNICESLANCLSWPWTLLSFLGPLLLLALLLPILFSINNYLILIKIIYNSC